jgi:two-component system response regulator NreC
MHRNEAYVYEALRSGAKAYVLKDDSADELITAIRQVKSGLCYLSSSLQLQSAKPFGDITDNANFDPLEQLTAREKEILYLAVKGLANADTSTKLGISRRTVETHSRHFMHKLGLSNRSQLIQFAIRHGISSKDKISNANL